MPEISIIMPAYNVANYLPQAIQSVIAQDFPDWELVIVDDGSKDDTYQIALEASHQDSRIKVIRQANGGVANARNASCRATDPVSKYLIFFDSDDIWTPEALRILRAALDANPGAPAAHAKSYGMDKEGNRLAEPEREIAQRQRTVIDENGRQRRLGPHEDTTLGSLLVWCAVQTGTIMMRRSAFEKTSGFREEYQSIDDWILLVELSRQGPIVTVDREIMGYRKHPGSISTNMAYLSASVRRFRREVLASSDYTPEQKQWVLAGYVESERQALKDKMTYITDLIDQREAKQALMQMKYCAGHLVRIVRRRP